MRSREQLVLHLVLHLDEIAREQTAFATLTQTVEALALGVVRLGILGRPQHVELVAREEIRVLRDDGRRFGALLLAYTDGTTFFGALECVRTKRGLVVGRSPSRGASPRLRNLHRGRSGYHRKWP